MGYLARHWPTVLGAVGTLPGIWHGCVWLFDWGARIDLVAAKLHEHGGLGSAMLGFY
jgi:hypothetical protein